MFTTDNGTETFTWPDGGQTPFGAAEGHRYEGGFRRPGNDPLARQGARGQGGKWHHFRPGLVPDVPGSRREPDIVAELKQGKQTRRKRRTRCTWMATTRLDLITGKGPSARHEVFYSRKANLAAVRIDDYKYRFID